MTAKKKPYLIDTPIKANLKDYIIITILKVSMNRIHFEVAPQPPGLAGCLRAFIDADFSKQFSNIKIDIIDIARAIDSTILENAPIFFFHTSCTIEGVRSMRFCEIRSFCDSDDEFRFTVIKVETLANLRDLYPLVGTEDCPLRIGRRLH